MSTFLPLFPLGIVAFPGEQVNLHIFEPRYKQLILECSAQETTFGISPHLNGRMMPVGTEMKLLEIVKVYPDGEMDIRTLGIRKYFIEKFQKVVDDKLYSGAQVMFADHDQTEGEPELKSLVVSLLDKFSSMLNVEKTLHHGVEHFQSYLCGHYIGLSADQEYTLLSLSDENERLNFIRHHWKK